MEQDQDPGKYTKMPDLKTLKFHDFYPNSFGQLLSKIGTTPLPNNFYPNSGLDQKTAFYQKYFGLSWRTLHSPTDSGGVWWTPPDSNTGMCWCDTDQI